MIKRTITMFTIWALVVLPAVIVVGDALPQHLHWYQWAAWVALCLVAAFAPPVIAGEVTHGR